jgi:hypothetical protein
MHGEGACQIGHTMVVYTFWLGQGDLHDKEEWMTVSYKWSPKRLQVWSIV